ncbi:carboxypeptidase-like regulatory domain-containing protein [Crocinitomicaceae bacterium]|nr:carboxypeptidase-like regulatory domain-containing protein [Crocinitomicaceae bacterium]
MSKRTQSFLSTNFPKVRTCLLVVTFLNFFWAQSQDSLVKAGYLIDCETLQPIPYGTIFTQEDRRGTISRQNGFFRIENLTKNDSLNFRAIGFTNLRLGLNEIFDTIFLCPKTQLLDDVIVLADTSFLFELVTKARKTQTTNARTSKAYFELQSFENEKQIELFQGYYNGKIQGYELTGLELKTAKFGLRRNKGRYFISTEASKAICLHQIFEESQYFPSNPFEMNKRNIRKNYLLQLSNKYKKPDGSDLYQEKILVISFLEQLGSTPLHRICKRLI